MTVDQRSDGAAHRRPLPSQGCCAGTTRRESVSMPLKGGSSEWPRLCHVQSMSNEELVLSAAAGNEASWEALVDRFSPLVWSVTRSFRLDRHTASDVFQEVWARLSKHIGSIREPSRIAGWLATTSRNEAIRVLRSADRERPDSTTTELGDALHQSPRVDDVSRTVVHADEVVAAVRALESLDERSQLLLRLLMAEPQVSYEDISSIMDMPMGSIGPTRARCLAKLRKVLEGEGYS